MRHKSLSILVVLLGVVITPRAQTFEDLVTFDDSNGANPGSTRLTQGPDGNLYGITGSGGAYNYGTAFQMTPTGELTTIHNFDFTDGEGPNTTLVLANDGWTFYGTTATGGTVSPFAGTIFKMDPQGEPFTLHNFCELPLCADGDLPSGALIQATDENLYGTTIAGGTKNAGTIYTISPFGVFSILYNFCSEKNCADGSSPSAGVIQGMDGNFYGTTPVGGIHRYGTAYKITPAGILTVLHTFCSEVHCIDGAYPYGGLVQGPDGNLYGTTYGGGIEYGTIYRITPSGDFAVIHNFSGIEGYYTYAGLMKATDGNFYGTASHGGSYSSGSVFKVSPEGKLTILHNFDFYDGRYPKGGLVQATNGTFYGTTSSGGDNGLEVGVIFSLSTGLGPFVETVPTSGHVGTQVYILGTNLTDTTKISFNGTLAQGFRVISPTELVTPVPPGAKTGSVEVTTPSVILKSNVAFQVIP